ncbi:CBS domain-containing protein [Clostridium grantii]|uniref:CBS domain-containing protein n=1 Tax=Clostridium grantii DSM 8605 TaxID=1121316 RepID=A0A1M5RTW2_9CLOT|nr:CBS domain-containing protein [Clostridium grantii]SHH29666.1 CBS domain-containing protein [Clostridium grantii DSM 8605]
MNIAFFLTPKSEVIYEKHTATMRQALERMEYHSYTAIPLIDSKGHYVGTLTEGDLLWKVKNSEDFSFRNVEKILVKDIPLSTKIEPVKINSDIEGLIDLAKSQNFVPVVDDNQIFIGIITRSDIINYCFNMIYNSSELNTLVVNQN